MGIGQFFYRVFCGFFVGLSGFAPGLSGSFIAIVTGIYHDLVRIISNPFKQFKKNVEFCIPIGIGVVLSAILFVIAFKYLFEKYEKAAYLLIVGLVAGNLPVIFGDVKIAGFKKHYLAGGIASFLVAVSLCVFATGAGSSESVQGVTSSLPWLAFGGFVAGVVILVPGMSFSMVLIVIGVFTQILYAAEALMHFDFTYVAHLGVFFVGAIIGLALASRGIRTIFKRYPGFANSLVFGFIAGSLIGILMDSLQIDDPGFTWLLGGIMLAAGLLISVLFVALGKKMKAK